MNFHLLLPPEGSAPAAGDRTKESLLSFADTLVPSAGQPHYYIRGVTRVAKSSGCQLSGFVLVKKVPGTLHFLAKSAGHSFDPWAMNMSHAVGYFYFGNKPSPRRRKVGMHPPVPVCSRCQHSQGQQLVSIACSTTWAVLNCACGCRLQGLCLWQTTRESV